MARHLKTIRISNNNAPQICTFSSYHVTYDYVNDGNADEVQLAAVCKVTVYASKDGYADSEVATIEIPVNAGGGLRGDLNDDSKVNALDIQEVINIASSEE